MLTVCKTVSTYISPVRILRQLRVPSTNAASPDQTFPILYIYKKHLLLVPHSVTKVHRSFPTTPVPDQRFTLRLSDNYVSGFREKHNKEPDFHYKSVQFVLDEDKVVVVALLSNGKITTWKMRGLLNGKPGNEHDIEVSSHPKDGYGIREWDLTQKA